MSPTTHPKDLIDLAEKLLTKGPQKIEKTPRRVRVLFDKTWVLDTNAARHVWEHEYYPQYYIPSSALTGGRVEKTKAVDGDQAAFLGKLVTGNASTDRVLVFEKGALAGLTRLEFGAMDSWFEEDTPIYVHPKDPYKRIDILPSTRRIVVKVNGVVVAESTMNMFLFETGLRPRYYMPKTAGRAEYYNLNVNGHEIADAIWWYRYPTQESALVAGMACFYNEKVEVFIDGEKEEN
ncbi:MAG: hypothetical protein L6R39_002843 [Caloplaca ligustica]|nr:MAG: hypothetical protein L6R39_002843 [Caloplaca ligustica]